MVHGLPPSMPRDDSFDLDRPAVLLWNRSRSIDHKTCESFKATLDVAAVLHLRSVRIDDHALVCESPGTSVSRRRWRDIHDTDRIILRHRHTFRRGLQSIQVEHSLVRPIAIAMACGADIHGSAWLWVGLHWARLFCQVDCWTVLIPS